MFYFVDNKVRLLSDLTENCTTFVKGKDRKDFWFYTRLQCAVRAHLRGTIFFKFL